MDRTKAKSMFETARNHVGDNVITPLNFEDVDLTMFLEQYLWAIFVAGFRNAIVEKHWLALKGAFANLDLERIVEMESIDAQTLPIRNQRKADGFLKGCKQIHEVGWSDFKERVNEHGRAVLLRLPFVGPPTSQLLALALGVEDTEKADIWMERCAEACYATVEDLVAFLSEEYDLPRQRVDNYLWQYCVDKGVPP